MKIYCYGITGHTVATTGCMRRVVNALGYWGLRAHVVASNNPAASNGYMSKGWFFYNGFVKLASAAIPRNGIVDIGVKL